MVIMKAYAHVQLQGYINYQTEPATYVHAHIFRKVSCTDVDQSLAYSYRILKASNVYCILYVHAHQITMPMSFNWVAYFTNRPSSLNFKHYRIALSCRQYPFVCVVHYTREFSPPQIRNLMKVPCILNV